MKRLMILLTALIVVFALAAPAAARAADSTGNPPAGTDILCGLWNGSNFNLTANGCFRSVSTSTTGNAGSGRYAALGDSDAAGLGLSPLSDPSGQDTACGRSSDAYPMLVASETGKQLIQAACSGATEGDLFTSEDVNGVEIPSQLDSAFAHGTPQLTTITAGANDVRWQDFLRACYSTDCMNGTSTAVASALRDALAAKLYFALADIQARSQSDPPQVMLTGYYNPLSAACAQMQPNITADEMAWLTGQLQQLNDTIQNVGSRFPFVTFVPVDFTGHDICSADPWVQGLNDPAPFHPTAAGQQVIAQAIEQAAGIQR